MAVGPQNSVLAPRFSRVLTALVMAICLATEISLIAYAEPHALVRATPGISLMAYASYAFFWAPKLRIDPGHLEITNPLRTITIAWSVITDITTYWTLTVETATHKYTAWSAPADSPWNSLGRLNRDALGRPSLGAESPRARSAGVGSIVIAQWQSHRQSPDRETAAVVVRWHFAMITILIVLVVLTFLGIGWP